MIILGGEDPCPALLRTQLAWADRVVAADRGIEPLIDLGCEPDLLVGDFDSVDRDISQLECEIERIDSQEATDFEKALARAGSANEIHILGGMGKQHDHFLTNLLIAASISEEVSVVLLGNGEALHRVTSQRPLQAAFPEGATVSLLPFAKCEGVTARGLKWSLDGVSMGIGGVFGQSNIVVDPEVRVGVESGVMYVALQTRSC